MLPRAVVLIFLALGAVQIEAINGVGKEWWRDTFIYQIYPRSFKDSDGNGVGDLNGIISKLDHLVDLNVSALWLSPIYTSPMADFGYDISNFTDVDPTFGNLDDFTRLTARAKSLGLKVLMDFVPNHSSDEHIWFKKSIQRIKPYDNYYIWQDAKMVNGTRKPPNNWLGRFGGSAWEWNSQRGQYYYHAFATGQPDFNYRNPALNQEMKDALTFWLDRGVDGFRIDSINFMFEDPRLLDEPVIPGTGLPADDWDTLDHIYIMDHNDSYYLLESWRKLVDDHTNRTRSDSKILLTEGYTALPLVMKYYKYGSDVPFNFMFISDLNNNSRPLDFKRLIDNWMNSMPQGYSANWVVGNHDNRRSATRFGTKRADQLSMLSAVLPGIGIIYNGDEIGMEDLWLSWNDTIDPAGCGAGPDRYHLKSRDPARTPFQWDSSVSAGFSTNNRTWLPVNPNYKTLNLAMQKTQMVSHYSVFKKLVQLKRLSIMKNGTSDVIPVTDNVLGLVRRLPGSSMNPIVLLINFSESKVTVDANAWMNIPKKLRVYVSSVDSRVPFGAEVDTTSLDLPGAASVILY